LNIGYEYYLIQDAEQVIGYFGLQIKFATSEILLSKLYLLKQHRGQGFGTIAMDFIVARAQDLNLSTIMLTLNRLNDKTIKPYQKYGFTIPKN
jgi:GNAT superfamily N-acetyltransferase